MREDIMETLRLRHVLAPTDLSESGAAALKYARLFADRTNATLTVLYCDPILYPFETIAGVSAAAVYVPTPEQQAQIEAQVSKCAEPWLHGRPYGVAVHIGQPVPLILRAAEEWRTDLIVMGTHARHGWRRAILGSVNEGVLHGSRCPVLTIRNHRLPSDDGRVAISKIVCPVNFSDVARDSLRYAAQVADAFNAELIVIRVIEPGQPENVAANAERLREWAGADVEGAYSYRELVLRGGAAERVLDAIDDAGADLLVVGAQHRLFRDATVIGTTTERLVRFASCPVLVVTRETVIGAATPATREAAHA
jgi:nucleotide-binding universal stress UspA family protein